MKRLLILACLISQFSQCQIITGTFGSPSTGTQIKGVLVTDKGIKLPVVMDFTPTMNWVMKYDTVTNALLIWNGTTWLSLAGGGGGGAVPNSLTFNSGTNTLTLSGTGMSPLSQALPFSNYVPKLTTLTINGVTQDLSTNRTWQIGPSGTPVYTNTSYTVQPNDYDIVFYNGSGTLTLPSAASSTGRSIRVQIWTDNGFSILPGYVLSNPSGTTVSGSTQVGFTTATYTSNGTDWVKSNDAWSFDLGNAGVSGDGFALYGGSKAFDAVTGRMSPNLKRLQAGSGITISNSGNSNALVISSSGTGTETDPIWTAASANYYTKTQADSRYLQSYTETDPTAVHIAGTETITGAKTFSSDIRARSLIWDMTSGNANLGKLTGTDFGGGNIRASISLGNTVNANVGSILPSALTANQTWTLPNATGTIALTSDIPAATDLSNYYTKTNLQTSGQALVHAGNITNAPWLTTYTETDPTSVHLSGTQTITGTKTFNSNIYMNLTSIMKSGGYYTTNLASMSTPVSGTDGDGVFYSKTDGFPYFKNSVGTEMPLFNSTSGFMANVITSKGDLIVGDASGNPTRLAAGTNGFMLQLISGTPAWVNGATWNGGLTSATIGAGGGTISSTTQMSIYTGTGGSYTLPALGTNSNYLIKNAGSGTLTVQRAGTDVIWDNGSVTSFTLAAGESVWVYGGVTSWYTLFNKGSSGTGSMVYPGAGIAVSTGSAWGTSITDNSTNWNTAYTQRLQWDGGSTNLVPATGRTSLGATTVGSNFFTLSNPSAVTFPRINADNTVSTLDAATFRTAIGAGTSSTNGTVTTVSVGNLSPLFTTSVTNPGTTPSITFTAGSTSPNSVFAGPASGSTNAAGAYRLLVPADIPDLSSVYGTVNYSASANRLAYYPSAGRITSPLPGITPNSILVSDANGLPVASTYTTTDLTNTMTGTGFTNMGGGDTVMRFIDASTVGFKSDSSYSTSGRIGITASHTNTTRRYNFDVASISGLISQGTNVTVTGSGTPGSPYVINSTGSGSFSDAGYKTPDANDKVLTKDTVTGIYHHTRFQTMNLTSPQNHDGLEYNGTDWVNTPLMYSKLTNPANDDILIDSANYWVNRKLKTVNGTSLIGTTAGDLTVTGSGSFSDAGYKEADANDKVLTKDTVTGIYHHTRMATINVASLATNDLLQFNGTDWVNKTPAQIRTSLGLATVATSGSYTDLINQPTIPTNTNQLTNGSGYITNATGLITQGTNVTITGSGTSGSPYVINSSATGGSMVYPGAGIAVSTGSAWGTSITDNSANWNTAYNKNTVSGTYSGGILTLTKQDATTVAVTGFPTNNNQLTNGSGYITSAALTGTLIGVRILTTGTAYTPTTGTVKINFILVGGGGGGGGVTGANSSVGAAGGGAAGGILQKFGLAVSDATTYTMAIGAAGTGGNTSGSAGSFGGSTTLTISGTTYTAVGGGGGTGMTAGTAVGVAAGGIPNGASTNGDINGQGQNGDYGVRMSGTVGISGNGGSSGYGIAGYSKTTAGNGVTATGYGSGGSGALSTANTNATGGNGAQGVIIIYEYK